VPVQRAPLERELVGHRHRASANVVRAVGAAGATRPHRLRPTTDAASASSARLDREGARASADDSTSDRAATVVVVNSGHRPRWPAPRAGHAPLSGNGCGDAGERHEDECSGARSRVGHVAGVHDTRRLELRELDSRDSSSRARCLAGSPGSGRAARVRRCRRRASPPARAPARTRVAECSPSSSPLTYRVAEEAAWRREQV
jgi:hypothetical protein